MKIIRDIIRGTHNKINQLNIKQNLYDIINFSGFNYYSFIKATKICEKCNNGTKQK